MTRMDDNSINIKRKKVLDVLSEIKEIAKRNSLPSIGPIKGKIIEEGTFTELLQRKGLFFKLAQLQKRS